MLLAGVKDFASPPFPPPWTSAAVFSNFHHPKILFPSFIGISDSQHGSLSILGMFWKTWSLKMQSPFCACKLCRFGCFLCRTSSAGGSGPLELQPWPCLRPGSVPGPEVPRLFQLSLGTRSRQAQSLCQLSCNEILWESKTPDSLSSLGERTLIPVNKKGILLFLIVC